MDLSDNIKNKIKMKGLRLSIYLCTGETDQVQVIERTRDEAERKFRIYHRLDDSEQVEIVNLTELIEH